MTPGNPMRNLVCDLDELTVEVNGSPMTFRAKDGEIRIPLRGGTDMVVTVDKSKPRQLDWLYSVKYIKPDGTPEPSGHTYGSPDRLRTGLGHLLSAFGVRS